jgi:hypothetical protein
MVNEPAGPRTTFVEFLVSIGALCVEVLRAAWALFAVTGYVLWDLLGAALTRGRSLSQSDHPRRGAPPDRASDDEDSDADNAEGAP